MFSLLIAFFTSLIITIIILQTRGLHGQYSSDLDQDGPQKFHTAIVPRIGGISIVLGTTVASIFEYFYLGTTPDALLLLLCALPAFFIGFIEDLTKQVSVRTRLLAVSLGALLSSLLLGAIITRLDLPGSELVLNYSLIAIAFTIFAISGVANAYNIIDGFHGLSSMVGIITLIALAYISHQVGDIFIFDTSLIMIGAILGIFIFNYPKGLIFLGDGGAYLIGFWIAILSVLIVCRNNAISPWFALLINAYPIWETIFTIYRRKFHQDKQMGHPDGLHLHTLIFRRIVNQKSNGYANQNLGTNARTSPYLWLLSSFAVIPAVLFWNSTSILILFFALFILTYSWLYKSIAKFKTPKCLFPETIS
jgi:UDP-GlcNAc:undecaprenyl-phosphate/decaprenyl-phosphate GlcNAc-1-phosphate transferase